MFDKLPEPLHAMNFTRLLRILPPHNTTIQTQQIRFFARAPFPNKVVHYLRRAELIDSIRLALRSNHRPPPNSLPSLLNTRLLDPFVATHAIRSAPNADSALSLIESLKAVPHFAHNQTTLHALATVLAKSGRVQELKALISDIKGNRYGDVRWYAATGDLEAVLDTWNEYRSSNEKRVCVESYNIVMSMYARSGKDSLAVEIFYRMIDEGAIPNCRSYTVMIEHLVGVGRLDEAFEIFRVLPLMRMKRTLKQYLVLVEGFVGAKRFGEVKSLLDEMRIDGKFPGRAMRLSLECLRDAGFVQETEELLREMSPDNRIESIGSSEDSSGEDENGDVDHDDAHEDVNVVRLKPWLDPKALANALSKWSPEVVSSLEEAKFVWTTRLIIDFYGVSKQADAALKIFREDRSLCGPIRNFDLMLLYSSILRTLTKCKRNSDATDVLEEMILCGICPDIQTFSGLMYHFALQGDIKTVQKLFSMVRQSGVEPDAYMFKLLIQAYCKCDRAALAWRVFEDMRNSNLMPDAPTKNLLVKSLWKEAKRKEAALVEESCDETNNVLPLVLQGHVWTVSSADLSRVYKIYSNSFKFVTMSMFLLFLFSSEALFLLLLLSPTNVIAQSPAATNFSCSTDSYAPCQAYIAYLAQAPNFLNLGNISDLFGVSRQLIASSSSLVSEDTQLFPNQLLLVPITCGCTGNRSFVNITYQIKPGDSYYFVSVNAYENLTNWQLVEDFNPSLDPLLLHPGDKVIFPLFCKCPSKAQSVNGIQFLITYVWRPDDDLLKVAAKLNASARDIVLENDYQNFSDAVNHPMLIPVSQLPVLSQQHPYPEHKKSKHLWITVVIGSILGVVFIVLLVTFLVHTHSSTKKKKTLDRNGSCLETTDLIQTKELKTFESFEPKTIQDKLLPGISGYLSKPVIFEVKEIMEATMDLGEHYRIGGSTYRANINGRLLAAKKTKGDITEELKILQKVNHANLVKLIGISSGTDGICFLVYEYAENGSVDKWLHPKSASSSSSVAFLTWTQRLHIALDVATGLHYMHEHIQPSIVHRDVRTSNILLDSRFRAKISNFSLAKPAIDLMIPKIDVFAFGVVLLELLSGKRAMVTKENGEIVLLSKEIKDVLEVAEKREERFKKWMDPKLESFYPIDGALNIANLARACTMETASARPSMAEVVFNLTVLTQTASETLGRSSTAGLEAEEIPHIMNPVIAR
ncbi:hypothetical protein Tsubulata_004363, partial [Turnera subulata]